MISAAYQGKRLVKLNREFIFCPMLIGTQGNRFCDIHGFASTPNLGKYLGILIKKPSSSSQDFNFILDRVKKKLVGWKANMLCLVGRSVLIQASLATIPTYVM